MDLDFRYPCDRHSLTLNRRDFKTAYSFYEINRCEKYLFFLSFIAVNRVDARRFQRGACRR